MPLRETGLYYPPISPILADFNPRRMETVVRPLMDSWFPANWFFSRCGFIPSRESSSPGATTTSPGVFTGVPIGALCEKLLSLLPPIGKGHKQSPPPLLSRPQVTLTGKNSTQFDTAFRQSSLPSRVAHFPVEIQNRGPDRPNPPPHRRHRRNRRTNLQKIAAPQFHRGSQ